MNDTIVSTPNGKIKGKLIDLKQKDAKLVYSYRNVPFAKPPVGSLRFMPPQPADPWDGIKDGTILGNKPMYPATFEEKMENYVPFPEESESTCVHDEDCLHLSVYTPHAVDGKNLPVMVWMYGGGFSMGSERDYDGSALAGMNEVVVVVPNYRVGVFGFFSLGSSSICTGNQGIQDQQLALKWVQNNIDAFGGDKDNVTIFGESAGGTSVNFHVMSPLSRGLFHRAISHSGTCIMPGLFMSEKGNTKTVKRFLEHFKIEENDENKIMEAIQKISSEDLLQGCLELMMERVSFQPMIDGKVLPKSPEDSIKDKDFAKVPYIFGCNSTEGQGILSFGAGPDFEKGITEEVAKKALFFPLTDEGFEKCKEFYIKPGDEDETRFSKMIGNMMGDAMFVARTKQMTSTYSEPGSDIYLYYANFQLKMFHGDDHGNMKKKVDWCICDHGDDVHMTFGVPFWTNKLRNDAKFSKEETELSRKFMTYITNFARNGNPNKGKEVEVTWPKYKPEKQHLVLAMPISTGNNLAEKETDFWVNVMSSHTERDPE